MGFRLEADMVAPAQSWLSRQVRHVKTEFRTPWGYCDLVGCSLNLRQVRKRISLRQRNSMGSLEKVDLLWQIPDEDSEESIDVGQLAARYAPWMDIDSVIASVAVLESKNFVVRDYQGRLKKRNGWFPLHKRLIAIEAKLTRVGESIWQATRHLAYADESYIALPSPLARKVLKTSRSDELRQLGLGLLAVSEDHCRVLIRSNSTADRDPVLQAHCVERFWRLHLTDNSS